MGSTVEQDRSHLAEQVEHAGERRRCADETHVPKAVLDKLAGMMGYTFPDEETQKFQDYTRINQNYWDQKLAAVERLRVFDDGENESLEDVFAASWTKRLTSRQPFLRRGVEMNIPKQPYLHRPP